MQFYLLLEVETKYFDSLTPFGDNQDYVDRLQQEIRNLRSEYAAKTRSSPNFQGHRKSFGSDRPSPHNSVADYQGNVDTFVRRSFWDDLAKVKEKIVRRNAVSNSHKAREAEEDDSRDVWYRTSRRYSDSR